MPLKFGNINRSLFWKEVCRIFVYIFSLNYNLNFLNLWQESIVLIIKPRIFEQYPEIIFGFNTKLGNEREEPFYFNVSYSVEDEPDKVTENRDTYFNALNLNSSEIAFQKQVHGNTVTYVDKPGNCGESDGMITDVAGLGLAVSTADCAAVFIYDTKNKVIAGVHSGWRGTQKKILRNALAKLTDDFNSKPENMIAYIAPSICQNNYEVGSEVADLFEEKFILPKDGKYLLDVAGANLDMLLNFGLPSGNIQKSSLCTFELKYLLHSYRRDGLRSGRSLGTIALKNK